MWHVLLLLVGCGLFYDILLYPHGDGIFPLAGAMTLIKTQLSSIYDESHPVISPVFSHILLLLVSSLLICDLRAFLPPINRIEYSRPTSLDNTTIILLL